MSSEKNCSKASEAHVNALWISEIFESVYNIRQLGGFCFVICFQRLPTDRLLSHPSGGCIGFPISAGGVILRKGFFSKSSSVAHSKQHESPKQYYFSVYDLATSAPVGEKVDENRQAVGIMLQNGTQLHDENRQALGILLQNGT